MAAGDPTEPSALGVAAGVSGAGALLPANTTGLPDKLQLQNHHLVSIVAYSLMIVISAPANIGVVLTLLRKRKRMKRLNLMLLHLAVADLTVTCMLMPMEIAWSATVEWLAGDVLCRLLSASKMFGLYLSNFVLVCISIDRYCAVVRPMSLLGSTNRCRRSLSVAWIMAAICSLPQALIFHVEKHPEYPHLDFDQCVSFGGHINVEMETAYLILSTLFLFPLPLIIITFCYTRIVVELARRTATPPNSDPAFRVNDSGFFVRARQRTLQMTFVIVLTFIICWAPYHIMALWYFVDKESARMVNPMVQRALFVFASANSVANPVVYVFYHSQLCLLSEATAEQGNFSKHRKSQSVELAILDTPRTCDTLLPQSSGRRPAPDRQVRRPNGSAAGENTAEVNQLL